MGNSFYRSEKSLEFMSDYSVTTLPKRTKKSKEIARPFSNLGCIHKLCPYSLSLLFTFYFLRVCATKHSSNLTARNVHNVSWNLLRDIFHKYIPIRADLVHRWNIERGVKEDIHLILPATRQPETRKWSWFGLDRVWAHRCLRRTRILWYFGRRCLDCCGFCLRPSWPWPNCRRVTPALSAGRPTIRRSQPNRI